MPDTLNLLPKAKLTAIKLPDQDGGAEEINSLKAVEVQFNPETLKVVYSNTVQGADQSGGGAIQYTSKSSTKCSVELWFDASVHPREKDVRKITDPVKRFLNPVRQKGGTMPPAVRFSWGSFLFEGVMDSVDETLEFFSADGVPLRAKVAISMTSQRLQLETPPPTSSGGAQPGTSPHTQARQGDSLQQMMGRETGRGTGAPGWQAVAAANGIENPRRMQPGAFVDLGAPAPRPGGGTAIGALSGRRT